MKFTTLHILSALLCALLSQAAFAKTSPQSAYARHVDLPESPESALTGAITQDTNPAGTTEIADTDGDGVADNIDDYPNDATKAFNNYSTDGGSTVMFEDQWPLLGDFDMNDLVITNRYNVVTNAKNIVVQVLGYYTLKATGGSTRNGYGIEFPISSKCITNLKGGTLEAGQDLAVIDLFSDTRKEMATWNTQPGVAQSPAKHYEISFEVKDGPSLNDFGTDYNPFLFNLIGQSRREVHTVGKKPTSLADQTLFGTQDDDTNTAAGRYYVSKDGLPYAISFPTLNADYPIEGKEITQAFKHFSEWGESKGTLYSDWYNNPSAGYRNAAFIYTK